MIQLVGIDEVRPSAYNPRVADPRRLDIIELSLRKLGFLIPVYADADGEILSGHHRHEVAQRIGCPKVPVEYTRRMSLSERKATNIVFNRATNDMSLTSTPKSLSEALAR
jgi:ParB-like chromosome segregation protein Spo0J